jgi:hypothetical protein
MYGRYRLNAIFSNVRWWDGPRFQWLKSEGLRAVLSRLLFLPSVTCGSLVEGYPLI